MLTIAGLSLSAQMNNCLDPSFAQQGILDLDAGSKYEQAVAVGHQSDGKMLVAGFGDDDDDHFFLQRYLVDGSIDKTFANAGAWTYGIGNLDNLTDLLILPNDDILIGATFNYDHVLFKFHPDGSPDLSFGNQGRYEIPVAFGLEAESTFLKLLPGGKIIAVGEASGKIVIARFHSDSAPDTSFGNNGVVIYTPAIINYTVNTVAAGTDGAVWVGGEGSYSDGYFLMKFKTNGSPDIAFGNAGLVTGKYIPFEINSINDLTPVSGGGIFVLGEVDDSGKMFTFLSKLNADGTPDALFGNNGMVQDTFTSQNGRMNDLFPTPDGTLLMSGRLNNDMVFVQYAPEGSRLTSYGDNGVLRTSYGPTGYNEALQLIWNPAVSRIYVLGYTVATYPQYFQNLPTNDVDITLTRLHANGNMDTGYGYQGKSASHVFKEQEEAVAVAVQNDGKAILAFSANYSTTVLMRILEDGTIDGSFGVFGKLALHNIQLLSDGGILLYNDKILLAGSDVYTIKLSVVRLTSNGAPDNSFGGDGQANLSVFSSKGYAIGIQNGKIIVAGCANCVNNSDFFVMRLLNDGSPDPTFGSNGQVVVPVSNGDDFATHLKVRSNGKIVAVGQAEINFTNYISAIQLLPNGQPDASFGTGGKVITSAANVQSWPASVMLLDNNKLLITGGLSVLAMQLQENGALDLSFSNDGLINGFDDLGTYLADAYAAALLNNQVIVGGTMGLDDIMLSFVSPSGQLAAPCNGTGKYFQSDLFENEWEQIEHMTSDAEARLWAFGTRTPENNAYNQIFLLRFQGLTTGAGEAENDQSRLFLYPNPVSGQMCVSKPFSAISDHFRIIIRDSVGRLILSREFTGSNPASLDVENFIPGFYFLILQTPDGASWGTRFVKK